jgi:hypothetical protein
LAGASSLSGKTVTKISTHYRIGVFLASELECPGVGFG